MDNSPFEEAALAIIEKREELNHLFDYHMEKLVDEEIKRAETFLGCSFAEETKQVLSVRIYNYFLGVVNDLPRKREKGASNGQG